MLNETKSEGFPVKEIWVSVGPTEGASKKREEGSVSFGPVTAHIVDPLALHTILQTSIL